VLYYNNILNYYMSCNVFTNKCLPILSEVAPQVQEQIIEEIHKVYPELVCLPIGSVGKKPIDQYNGDIDIAIKCNTIEELESIVKSVFYYLEQVKLESYYIVSIPFPYQINGEEEIRYVQCDFMLMWDEEYTKFRYYCPNYINNESKYKVGAKIMFTNMILNHVPARYENISEGMKAKFDFRPTALYRYIYDFKNKRYKEEYVTNDVGKIVNMCFTDGDRNHFNSVESIWEAIHSNIFVNHKEVKSIEKNWFVNCWRKGWTSIVPEDFKLQYWTNDEIWKFINRQDYINKINQLFDGGREI